MAAPQTSIGIGGTSSAAASCWISSRPTCGPLPCVRTSAAPVPTSSASAVAAATSEARISPADPVPPGGLSALPPSATTTCTAAPPHRLKARGYTDRTVSFAPENQAVATGSPVRQDRSHATARSYAASASTPPTATGVPPSTARANPSSSAAYACG